MEKATILILVLIATIAFGSCSNDKTDKKTEHEYASEVKDIYTCPMHPSVISDRPGACPVCGMALVKKSAQHEMSAEESAMLHSVSLSPSQRILTNVMTTPVERRNINSELAAVGVVDFAEPFLATVSARFRGRIEKLNVNFTGETVRKGQPLFQLYSPELISAQQDFLIAAKAYTQARASGNNVNSEMQERILSSIRERLRMHYGLTDAQIDALKETQKALPTVTFYAPISGTIIGKEIQEGQYVDEGAILYRLADLSRVWIYLEVYENYIRFVRIGQTVTISTDAYPNFQFSGRVTFIDPVMNPETRTVRVRTEFANPSGKLKPQMYVKSIIAVPSNESLVVPVTAVISTGKRSVVWVEVAENRFEPRDVVVGAKTDGFYEIISGLEEGEMVVASGGYLIDSESQLQSPGATAAHDHGSGISADKTQDESEFQAEKRFKKDESNKKSVREIKIIVDYEYQPSVIRVKRGIPVRLLFYRKEDSKCTEEVVFQDFGIRKKLPAFKTTVIDLNPEKVGEYRFTCGMDMLDGKLIVEK